MKTLIQSMAILLALFGLIASAPPTSEPITRPDLNGTRVRAPGSAAVYLIDNGFRRAVPNMAAYEALFRDWECIVEDLDIEAIRLGDPLGDSAGLIKCGESSGVYFTDGSTRRHVANPQVMDKYRFAWERVRSISAEEMERLPQGPTLR